MSVRRRAHRLRPAAGGRHQARDWREAQFDAVEELDQVTDGYGLSLAQVAVARVLANPVLTSAIVGATSPDQLAQTLPASELALSAEVKAACDEAWFQLPRERNAEVALR